jgi:hypothetical protein
MPDLPYQIAQADKFLLRGPGSALIRTGANKMFKYRWMSKTQWLLKYVDEQTIAQVWLRAKREAPDLADEQVAKTVEDYFGVRNRLQANPS